MSLLDQVRALEQQVNKRLRELGPLVAEYRDLEKVAERLGLRRDAPKTADTQATDTEAAKPSAAAKRKPRAKAKPKPSGRKPRTARASKPRAAKHPAKPAPPAAAPADTSTAPAPQPSGS